eukprot:SAG31_NODE_26856_length_435_cov_0.925595_1_plen_70_part_10
MGTIGLQVRARCRVMARHTAMATAQKRVVSLVCGRKLARCQKVGGSRDGRELPQPGGAADGYATHGDFSA